MGDVSVVEQLTRLRQAPVRGARAPHKPLLVLLALGQLTNTGSSAMDWLTAKDRLQGLLAEFGTSATVNAQSAAQPFTRLRSDGVWELSRAVTDDQVKQLNDYPVEGRFTSAIEQELLAHPETIAMTARTLVDSQFPMTLAPDVLLAVGLDPEVVYGAPTGASLSTRKRNSQWRDMILAAWDRSCAFCGFDGSLSGAPVGIDAAHVRWFKFEGPDAADNGLALCSLHHRLFDSGALGLSDPETVAVSERYSANTDRGRALYDLHGRHLQPRPGTTLPAIAHVDWHRTQVFKGVALSA